MSDFLRILGVLLLIAGNAYFVVAEYALVTARRTRLQERADRGSRGARVAVELMDNPVRFISTVQVGITALGILLGALGEPLLRHFFDPVLSRTLSFILAFAIMTYLSVAFGELVPKAVALQKAESIAVFVAIPVDWLARLAYPIVWLLQASAHGVLRLLGIRSMPTGVVVHTEEEIRNILAEAEETGVIEEAEEEMLYKVFDFADKEVREVMVPRPEVVAISVDLPAEECLAAIIDSPYTRYPAYRGSLDEIVGVLHVRDLFSATHSRGLDDVSVEELLRPVYLIPETKDLAVLLGEFRRTKQHMAVVVDEYGSMQGIVTLEDLLEEIVGEIDDEFDLPDDSIVRIDERRIEIDGTYPIDDFNEQFAQALPQEDFHTLAGFVFGELGRAPEPGDEVAWDGLRFEVVDIDGARIGRLRIEFLPDQELEAVGEPDE
ncbi:MAG: hemolysin family protein [Thermoleophilia bacterium]